jgi:hypothetical protein
VAAALLLAACGSDDGDETSADAAATTEASETDDATGTTDPDAGADAEPDPETSVTTEPDDGATTTEAETTTTTEPEPAADVVITGALVDGELRIDDRRFEVPLGSSVLIQFTADETEHVHLHGYDILADVGPDLPVEMLFVADSPGTFEVELEDSHRFLFEILVR